MTYFWSAGFYAIIIYTYKLLSYFCYVYFSFDTSCFYIYTYEYEQNFLISIYNILISR